jgi:hypothetical protein
MKWKIARGTFLVTDCAFVRKLGRVGPGPTRFRRHDSLFLQDRAAGASLAVYPR